MLPRFSPRFSSRTTRLNPSGQRRSSEVGTCGAISGIRTTWESDNGNEQVLEYDHAILLCENMAALGCEDRPTDLSDAISALLESPDGNLCRQ